MKVEIHTIAPLTSNHPDIKGEIPNNHRVLDAISSESTTDIPTEWIKEALSNINMPLSMNNKQGALLLLMLNIPLTQENMHFILQTQRLPDWITFLISKATEEGLYSILERLQASLPELSTLPYALFVPHKGFKGMLDSLRDIHLRFSGSGIIPEGKEDWLTWMSLHLLERQDASTMNWYPIPIRHNKGIYAGELWINAKSETLWLTVQLPNMGPVGCLIKDWSRVISIELYCEPDQVRNLKAEINHLRTCISRLVLKPSTVVIHETLVKGYNSFLSRHNHEQYRMDVKV